MLKINRALSHYLLAFAVLFASSAAMFHVSEHIVDDSHPINFSSIAHQHAFTDTSGSDFSAEKHSIESLCESCLVLSNLSSHLLNPPAPIFLGDDQRYHLSDERELNRPYVHLYHARAPPPHV